MVGSVLKDEIEGFPDLEAAFEAVKGMLFGPLDPHAVKLKFNEIVKDAKDKRELELNGLGPAGLAHQERDRSERRDRDHQHMTLTALLATNAAYRAAWEDAMDGLPELGAAMDDFQDKIDAALAGERALLKADLERVAARLPDGRYVFKGADGSIVDENLQPLQRADAQAAKTVEFTGKMTLEDYRARKGKVECLETMADDNRRDRAEVAGIHAELTDKEDPPQSQERVEELGAKKEAAKDRFEERVKEAQAVVGLKAEAKVEADAGISLSRDVLAKVDLTFEP